MATTHQLCRRTEIFTCDALEVLAMHQQVPSLLLSSAFLFILLGLACQVDDTHSFRVAALNVISEEGINDIAM